MNEQGKCEQYFESYELSNLQCKKINTNCIIGFQVNHSEHLCTQCSKETSLISSGKCKKIQNCLEFKIVCRKCESDYYLLNGLCFKIF